MMGGMSPETCWAITKHWNNKFYYTVASSWFLLWVLLVYFLIKDSTPMWGTESTSRVYAFVWHPVILLCLSQRRVRTLQTSEVSLRSREQASNEFQSGIHFLLLCSLLPVKGTVENTHIYHELYYVRCQYVRQQSHLIGVEMSRKNFCQWFKISCQSYFFNEEKSILWGYLVVCFVYLCLIL